MLVKKAVFPVAGLGSRFLPATKANPKEMLPVVDKPLIQYAVEEAIRAGMTHMIFITSSTKRAIEDHFDSNYELESRLLEQHKNDLLALVKNISPPNIQFTYVRQSQPKGLGHAILCAEHVVGNDPFAVLLADDLIDDASQPCLSAMVKAYEAYQHSIIAVQPVPWENVHRYGVVDIEPTHAPYPKMLSMIEKPAQEDAPSNLSAIGRYIFTPGLFSHLKNTSADRFNEIQLTNGIQTLLHDETILTWNFQGKRYDCGDKLEYLKAIVELAKKHKHIGKQFSAYLANQQPASTNRRT